MNFLKRNLAILLYFALTAFPLFYFVYKYSSPYVGMIDFFDYYKLYERMDFHSADSPLNMRLLSSFFVYLLNSTGLSYNTVTQIDGAPFQKSIYFNAVFLNYIWVVFTCFLIYKLARKRNQSKILSLFVATLYLLGFGTIFYELMPLADALAVLLFALFLWFYSKRSHLVLIPLFLLVFQREYLLLAIGLLTLLDFLKFRNRYLLLNFFYCVLFFSVYVVLRKVYFETPRYAHHTSLSFLGSSIFTNHFPILPFIRQTLMTMNIGLIYFALVFYKMYRGISFQKHDFNIIVFLLMQVVLLAFLLALGNNTGRYFYMLLPLILLLIGDEVKVFLEPAEK